MQNKEEQKYEREIRDNYDGIAKLKKQIPLGILTMTALSFLYPLIPGRRSKPLADLIGYPYSVIACLVVGGLIYFFGYKIAVKKRIQKINDLKTKLQLSKEE